MGNLYTDAVLRQLESIGKPVQTTTTGTTNLNQGIDISSLLMMLWLSGIFGKNKAGTAEPMLPNTPLPTTLESQQVQYSQTPASATSGVPSLGNIDLMSLVNMFSKLF